MKYLIYLMRIEFILIFLFTSKGFSLIQEEPIIQANQISTNIATTNPQSMQILTSGIASFEKRLQIISLAQKTIEVEYYIFNTDLAGRLFTQALISKAKKGVKVRLLVDRSLTDFQLDNYFTTAIKTTSSNIEIKYYNKSKVTDFIKNQFRSHRKSLIVDNTHAIIGGRNMADAYFDLSQSYNFLDTDVYIKGSIVKDIKSSFEQFWNHPITENTRIPNNLDLKRQQLALKFITPNQQDNFYLSKIHQLGEQVLKTQIQSECSDSQFVADSPGIGVNTRELYRFLKRELESAQFSLSLEAAYFIIDDNEGNIISNLREKNVEVNVLTNSLYSSDSEIPIAPFYSRTWIWTEQGVNLWIYDGTTPKDLKAIMNNTLNSRWGTHTKSAVIDDQTTMIGSFNVDPRSKNLNSEMAIICRKNKTLAKAVTNNFQLKRNQSVKLDYWGEPEDGRGLFFNVPMDVMLSYSLIYGIANAFDFLL